MSTAKHLASGSDGAGHRDREVPGPGADVGDRHSRPEPELLHDDGDRQPLLAIRIVELVRVLVMEDARVVTHRRLEVPMFTPRPRRDVHEQGRLQDAQAVPLAFRNDAGIARAELDRRVRVRVSC